MTTTDWVWLLIGMVLVLIWGLHRQKRDKE